MRILQVSAYAPPWEGGSERFCFNLTKTLIQKGHEAEIYTSRLPPNLPWREIREGVPITRFRCVSYLLQINPFVFFMRAVERNLHLWNLIHVHSYIYFLANQIAVLRKKRRFPFILHLHGGLGYLYPQLASYKATAMKIFYDHTLGAFTMKTADHIIACCENDRLEAVEKFHVDPEKITVVPNSIDTRRFTQSTPHNPVNIVFVGRISELKGCHQLPYIMEAIQKRYGKTVEFTFVGGGPKELQFRTLCKQKHLPATFTGRVPNSVIPQILSKSDIMILPSFVEGFPIVCLESLASAVPVIAYDVGGVKEIVRDGETGFLVPAGDEKKFVERVCWLIENEDDRRRMGIWGRRAVEENFEWEKAVDKIEMVYESVV